MRVVHGGDRGAGGVSPVTQWAGEGAVGDDAGAVGEGRAPLQEDLRACMQPLEEPISVSSSVGLSFSLCLSVGIYSLPEPLTVLSLGLSFLGSGHLREMSVRDKDTGKNPGRAGGQAGSEVRGTRTAEPRDRR